MHVITLELASRHVLWGSSTGQHCIQLLADSASIFRGRAHAAAAAGGQTGDSCPALRLLVCCPASLYMCCSTGNAVHRLCFASMPCRSYSPASCDVGLFVRASARVISVATRI